MTADGAGAVACDVVVVGGGPAGLMAAVAVASTGAATVLVAGRPVVRDNRTTALLAGSVDALKALRVWDGCREAAAPLRTLRIVDDTGRLWRAPEVRFEATEIGLDAFGWNIANRDLVTALEARAATLQNLSVIREDATAVAVAEDSVTVGMADGRIVTARLAVASDGRRSVCREAAGISTRGWSYPQTALTFNLKTSRDHQDISTEFHSGHGPFTLVPLPGRRVSVVCVVAPREAERLQALDAAALDAEMERRSHSILGRVTVEPDRGVFPLSAETAECFGASRVVLVGEAAHVFPPIGAQGLNLGFRDAATVAELVADARRDGRDPGGPEVTSDYDRRRRTDVTSRTLAVDLLNRSLLSDLLPVQGVRGAGLWLLSRLGPLRRAVMREGVAPATAEPKLLRGEPLG
ncbi:UbiH/UbiF family hydroxylase [Rhodoplanes roseus]|uniref:2-octaprenyl-6-methoxyphenyl hydroxylase n=1 Tax=Rhodoplanes roseus TaxID=29409 RepID=A0A327L1P6_9BRAD|nr:UbiH/UbiF family hydroxylase [Rhodoplanes roseus]RAI44297.1 2-octaprenyl-6-methoxyphenyl hydroxylase [Rhodoplanes roseus]